MKNLNPYIEHTLLKPVATKADIITLCKEAVEHEFYGICINSCWIKTAKKELSGTDVKIVTVIDFPLGASSTEMKIVEAKQVISDGADEVDMVLNIGFLKSGLFSEAGQEIHQIKKAMDDYILKVIIETCFLTDEEKKVACRLCLQAGADLVKTSTGFGTAGATVQDVRLMQSIVGEKLGIKASGGIKTAAQARNLIDAGASRIGTSSGIEIVSEH